MCHYCGCRQLPLIRDYVAEHERATTLAGDAARALDRLELAEARRLLGALLEELSSHWRGEVDGLFPAALIALDGVEWDAAMAAWAEAHPGEQPLSG